MAFFQRLIQQVTSTKEKKVLLENFLSLSFLQAASYLLPLITLPYLVRVLGPAKFGLVAFAQAFVQYFAVITDYGFNYSATQDISVNRNNVKMVSKIFNSVILIKLSLAAVCLAALCMILALIPKFGACQALYMYAYILVIGSAIFPQWFFQGIERMKYITVLNIIAKLIFTIAIFIFIRKEEDYLYVPLINSLGYLSIGIISMMVVYKGFNIKFALPAYKDVTSQFIGGWHVFISMISVSLYTTSNVVILGFFADDKIVGYYSAAEKIIDAVKRPLVPWAQSVFPYVTSLADRSAASAMRFLRNMLALISGCTLVVSISVLAFAGFLVGILLGRQYADSVIVLRIISFSPFFVGVTNLLGVQMMLAFGMKKAFSRILIMAAAVNITAAFMLASQYKHIGIAVCMPLTEIFITVSMLAYLVKKGIITSRFIFQGEMSKSAADALSNK
jgi:PST family polysaccharide transporter